MAQEKEHGLEFRQPGPHHLLSTADSRPVCKMVAVFRAQVCDRRTAATAQALGKRK